MLTPDEYGSYDPREVAAEVAAVIRLRPGRWDQSAWFAAPMYAAAVQEVTAGLYETAGECGSTACVCGWAAILTAEAGTFITDSYLILPDGTSVLIYEAGQAALCLNGSDARWLFHGTRHREQVLAALDSLAKGERMRRLYDYDLD